MLCRKRQADNIFSEILYWILLKQAIFWILRTIGSYKENNLLNFDMLHNFLKLLFGLVQNKIIIELITGFWRNVSCYSERDAQWFSLCVQQVVSVRRFLPDLKMTTKTVKAFGQVTLEKKVEVCSIMKYIISLYPSVPGGCCVTERSTPGYHRNATCKEASK